MKMKEEEEKDEDKNAKIDKPEIDRYMVL